MSDPTIKVARILTFSPTQTVQVGRNRMGNFGQQWLCKTTEIFGSKTDRQKGEYLCSHGERKEGIVFLAIHF